MEVRTYIAMLNKDVHACCQEGEEKHENYFFFEGLCIKKAI